MTENRPQATGEAEKPRVTRVREGLSSPATVFRREADAAPPPRTFSVVLAGRMTADEAMALVSTAIDPVKPELKIPAAGEPHPEWPGFVARPPMIFPVGLRLKGGPLVASRTNFYNVRVHYVQEARLQATDSREGGTERQPLANGDPEAGSQETRLQATDSRKGGTERQPLANGAPEAGSLKPEAFPPEACSLKPEADSQEAS